MTGASYGAFPVMDCVFSKIRLTTISQRPAALARSSVRLLLELIESGDGTEFTQRLLTPALVERATCRDITK